MIVQRLNGALGASGVNAVSRVKEGSDTAAEPASAKPTTPSSSVTTNSSAQEKLLRASPASLASAVVSHWELVFPSAMLHA